MMGSSAVRASSSSASRAASSILGRVGVEPHDDVRRCALRRGGISALPESDRGGGGGGTQLEGGIERDALDLLLTVHLDREELRAHADVDDLAVLVRHDGLVVGATAKDVALLVAHDGDLDLALSQIVREERLVRLLHALGRSIPEAMAQELEGRRLAGALPTDVARELRVVTEQLPPQKAVAMKADALDVIALVCSCRVRCARRVHDHLPRRRLAESAKVVNSGVTVFVRRETG